MTESQFSQKVVKYLTKKGFYVINIIQASRAGVPDLIATKDGIFYALELKTPTGRVSPLQEAHIKLIKESGGRAGVAKNMDDVNNLIKGEIR